MNFDTCFDRLINNEGGYVNNPADPGGETNWGITWPTLNQAIGMGLVPTGTTIAKLTRDQSRAIYQKLFWQNAGMDYFAPPVAFQVFDAAVNHGIGNAVRLLQRAVAVVDDGVVGPVTVTAVLERSVTDVLMLFLAERIDFWTKSIKWKDFGRGWARRAAQELRYAAEDT